MRRTIIVGIDPGTTAAYAILDSSGNVVKIRSGKDLGKDKMISEITEYGDVAIVASDVNPAPSTVKFISTSFSAKLVYPESDMSVDEKRKLSKLDGNVKNTHERDALGAAFRAFKDHRDLIDRIKRRSDRENEERVMKLVLSGKVKRIASALEMVNNDVGEGEFRKSKRQRKSRSMKQAGFNYSLRYPPVKRSKPVKVKRVKKKTDDIFSKERFLNWLKEYRERKTR